MNFSPQTCLKWQLGKPLSISPRHLIWDPGPSLGVCLVPFIIFSRHSLGLPRWLSDKESTCQCKETWLWSLDQEDPQEEGMTTHSSILTWELSRTEEPGRLQSMGWQRVRHDWACTLYDSFGTLFRNQLILENHGICRLNILHKCSVMMSTLPLLLWWCQLYLSYF